MTTLKQRWNDLKARFNGMSPTNSVNIEHLVTGSYDRYTDPLIRWKYHNLKSPADREEVAATDPIANILTWSLGIRGNNRYPKFYDSDEIEAQELGLQTRDSLKLLNMHEPSAVAFALAYIHGWSVTVYNTDKNGDLDYYIFSERECKPEMFIRDENQRVIGWNVYEKPRIPLGRTNVWRGYGQQKVIMRDDPGVVYLTLGDEKKSYGFGYSKLEATWDSITKLREESHANAFRARVFPISVVPANWKKENVKDYMEAISRMDMMNALVSKSGTDGQGNPIPELPSFNWVSPGTNASSKSSQGGGGVFSDLSSEWSRLCGITRRSIRYFTGNPGGALAAAEIDQEQDSIADIEDFNMAREWWIQTIEFLRDVGAPIDLPDSYVLKGHWEWERDELRLQESMMAELELQNGQEEHEKNMMEDKSKENKQYIDVEIIKDWIMNAPPGSQPSSGFIDRLKGKWKGAKFGTPSQQPGTWLPVNSKSGNVEEVLYDDQDEKIYVKFKGESLAVEYSPPGGENFANVADRVQKEGGEAVWRELRGLPSAGHYKPGQTPMGKPKKPGAKTSSTPLAGAAHKTDYKYVTPPSAKQAQGKGLVGTLKSFLQKRNEYDSRHPLLIKHNSISAIARNEHHSKTTVYKMLDEVKVSHRFNEMHFGNSFSTSNPFIYADPTHPLGYTVEYQCPDEVKKLVGNKVPIWISHDLERDNSGIPPKDDWVGYYEITGWDEEKGIENATYEIDWDAVDAWFEKHNKENWVERVRKQGKLPDTSTEYICNVHYDRERDVFIQKNFNLKGLALVEKGNCSKGHCQINST